MDAEALRAAVARYRDGGWRLVVVNATAVRPAEGEGQGDGYDVSWSFARGAALEHLRERLGPGEPVPSISPWYPSAYLYENELRELFGIEVTGMAVDLHGELYRTAERIPFSVGAIRARLRERADRAGPVERPGSGDRSGSIKQEETAGRATPADRSASTDRPGPVERQGSVQPGEQVRER